MIEEREIRHFHFCCGLGAAALGFNRGRAELNGMRGRFRCIGGVDSSPAAVRDFTRITGVRGTVLDLFDRQQYRDFHGSEPPSDWREATPADIHKAAGNERPNIVFISAPCKGFSGLLSESRSRSEKYQALNRLTLRSMWLMCETWSDDPPELIIFENVPRIATRGRALLDQIGSLLRHYGYAVAETFHDCGEIGGLAQSRKRFLMVARHVAKVPPFLYEPPKRPLRAVGEILELLPMPGDLRGGPMHAIPNLQWKTWVRLAFVEAGSDWRSLNKLRVVDGKLADYLLVPELRNDTYGVNAWESPTGTVTGDARPMKGAFSVADPRFAGREYGQYRVHPWEGSMGAIGAGSMPGQGGYAVADPRHHGPAKFNDRYRIVDYSEPSRSVTGASGQGQCVADPRPKWEGRYNVLNVRDWKEPCSTVIGGGKGVQGGWLSIADPRFPNSQGEHASKYSVLPWEEPSKTITGSDRIGSGALCVADPRCGMQRGRGDHYLTAGHYGVVPWDEPCGAVSAAAGHDSGRWNVADPRLPEANEKLVAVIRSLDNTWHRPFTTLELAALQSLVDPENLFDLDGASDSAKRERIGNAVPPASAQAIADLMGQTLLMAWSGQTFALSATPIWVRPIVVALSVKTPEAIA